tara:strand:+ start:847 stop:1758 length:912 start_codon:yes stop_codon:yes gene_type:complete
MKRDKIIIGSRGSKLALIYANKVKEKIMENLSINVEIKSIVTSGDINQKDRLSEVGGKGMFSKKIEIELLENNIDLAVHALKDMPSIETDGLITNCFLKRNYPNEILISNNNIKFNELKSRSIIGTSSFRREYQLKQKRNDLIYKLIRGNVDTRIKKLTDGLYDAIILSKAGIDSLNLNKQITQEFSVEEIVPSVGQGVIAVQSRKNDDEILKILEKINHEETNICVTAERELLKTLEGDCSTAVGAISALNDNSITLSAELFSVDGKARYFIRDSKSSNLAKELGNEVGKLLKEKSKGSYKN